MIPTQNNQCARCQEYKPYLLPSNGLCSTCALEITTEAKPKVMFETGAVRDSQTGKENYPETISYLALKRFAVYMTGCGDRYGLGNFKKGIPIESYEASLMRHIQKYFANKYEGASLEPEVDHLSAMMFNIQGILYEEERAKLK